VAPGSNTESREDQSKFPCSSLVQYQLLFDTPAKLNLSYFFDVFVLSYDRKNYPGFEKAVLSRFQDVGGTMVYLV